MLLHWIILYCVLFLKIQKRNSKSILKFLGKFGKKKKKKMFLLPPWFLARWPAGSPLLPASSCLAHSASRAYGQRARPVRFIPTPPWAKPAAGPTARARATASPLLSVSC
jgi:hypothetical protein